MYVPCDQSTNKNNKRNKNIVTVKRHECLVNKTIVSRRTLTYKQTNKKGGHS